MYIRACLRMRARYNTHAECNNKRKSNNTEKQVNEREQVHTPYTFSWKINALAAQSQHIQVVTSHLAIAPAPITAVHYGHLYV